MRAPLLWAGGIAGSLLAHVAAFGFLNLSVQPDPTPTQPKPETKLAMDTYAVDRQKAAEAQAETETAQEQNAQSEGLDAGAIPQSRAEAASAKSDPISAQTPVITATKAQAPEAPKATASRVDTAQINAVTPLAQTAQLSAATMQAQTVSATTATSAKIQTSATKAQPIKAAGIAPTVVASAQATALPVEPLAPVIAETPQATPETLAMLQLEAPSDTAPLAVPNAQTASPEPATGDQTPSVAAPTEDADQPPLPSTFAKADTAWNFGDRIVTDPTALATIQAFMSPEALSDSTSNAGRARDGLEGLLASVDCARLSATFIPETGALELRGHVPDNALRAPILKTLQDQIGEGITVTDNLRHLPKPQCGALTGIADIGLPQSTDQLTNKRLIGDNAQAVEYTYSEGQALGFDMTAPDYAAVVYVDYFDAGGQVIHLVPNEVVPLTAYTPAQVVGIERGEGPRLNITIGPPFGQEIAVAFAASTPLYEGVRPIIEPAEPYLEFLKTKVAEAREADPDFKGEWVYFFITTQPATQ